MKAAIEADDRALHEDQPRVLDIEFIEGHTAGFEALCADLRTTPWAAIKKQSGLARAQLEEAAQVYLKAKMSWPVSAWASRNIFAALRMFGKS
jgi:hypothetical protein